MRRSKRPSAPPSLPPLRMLPSTDEAIREAVRDALRISSPHSQALKISPEVDYDEDAQVAEGDWPAATIAREMHDFIRDLPIASRVQFAAWQIVEAEQRAAHPDIVCAWQAITLALLADAKHSLEGIRKAMAWRDLARRHIGRSGARRLGEVMVLHPASP